MADQQSFTPRMATQRRDFFATPESWEMRADTPTPAGNHFRRPEMGFKSQRGSAWEVDGMSDSFCGFYSFDHYETPPGATLYRNQFDDSFDNQSFSISEKDNSAEMEYAEKSEHGSVQDVLIDNTPDMKEDLEVECDTSVYAHATEMSDVEISGKEHLSSDEVPVVCNDASMEGSPSEREKHAGSELSKTHNVCDHSDIQTETSGEHDNESLAREGRLSVHCNSPTMIGADVNEECILERMDHEQKEEQDFSCQSIDEYRTFSPCTGDLKSVSESHSMQEGQQQGGVTQQASCDCNRSSEAITISPEAITISPEAITTSPEPITMNPEVGGNGSPETSSHFVTDQISRSLMKMDIPQNCAELDQLADFLQMEDPFQNVGGTHTTEDIEKNLHMDKNLTEQNIPAHSSESTLSPCPKRQRRKKKTASTSERRRSVRIARRESLQRANFGTVGDVNPVDADVCGKPSDPVNIGLSLDHLNERQELTQTLSLGPGDGSKVLISKHNGFEHLGNDLSITKTAVSKKKNRRRSAQLQKTDLKVNTFESPCRGKQTDSEPMLVGESACNSAFLADFADFGLGDDWMPGDLFGAGQFAKTPMKTPGRRKSARLSGVPIPLLELCSKSTIKVCGAQGMTVDDVPQMTSDEGCLQDDNSGWQAETQGHVSFDHHKSKPENDLLENFGELPFEQPNLPAVKTKGRRKRAVTERRRSVRLLKKPQMIACEETGKGDLPTKNSNVEKCSSHRKKVLNTETATNNSSQEILKQDYGIINNEAQACEDSSFPETELSIDSEMDWQHLKQDTNGPVDPKSVDAPEAVEPLLTDDQPVARDSPFIGRRRVSRVWNKENDEVQASSASQDEEKVHMDGGTTLAQETVERKVLSPNNGIKITKKIKQLYLNKGQDAKKHKSVNLETIFEKPVVRGKGTVPAAIGARRMKRVVTFTETPWLGRPGRSKGRKVKKGKPVKQVLSSKREKSWKLDVMLSSLDDISP